MPDTRGTFLSLLRESFDESELRDICFHLGIDYESLPGQDKRGKTRSLIELCLRAGRAKELATYCHELRPNVEWPKLTRGNNSGSHEQNPQTELKTPKRLQLPTWIWGGVILVGISVSLILFNNIGKQNNANLLPTSTQQNISFAQTPTETIAETPQLVVETPEPQSTSTPPPPTKTSPFPGLETITIDNAANLKEVAQLGSWNASWKEFSFSPDGERMAIGSVNGLYIYDAQSLEVVQYEPTMGHVSKVTYSPSGRYLAYDIDGELQIYDLQEEALEQLESQNEIISDVSELFFTPNNALIIGSGNGVTFWLPQTNEFLKSIPSLGRVTEIAVTTDMELLAIGDYDGHIQVWFIGECLQNPNVVCSEIEFPFEQQESWISGLAFLPNGRFLATSSEDSPYVNLWDFSDCTNGQNSCGHLFGTLNPTWAVWNWETTSLRYSPDGQILAAGAVNGRMEFWEVDLENSAWDSQQVDLHGGAIVEIEFSPDDLIIGAAETNGSIRFWNLQESNLIHVMYDHVWISSMALSEDNTTVLLGAWSNVMRLLSLDENRFTQTWGELAGWVASVALSHDSRFAAGHTIGDSQGLWVWQIDNSESLINLGRDKGTISSIAFSPVEDKIVAGNEEGKWYLWNDFSNDALHLTASSTSPITATVSNIAYSSDGQLIATGHEDGTIQLWDAGNGDLLSHVDQAHEDQINSIIFAPNDQMLASGGDDGEIILWNLDGADIEPSHILDEHSEAVTSLSFSPDNTLLVSGSLDNSLRLWQTSNGNALKARNHEYGDVHSVDFSSDGTFIVSSGSDGVVHIWGIEQ